MERRNTEKCLLAQRGLPIDNLVWHCHSCNDWLNARKVIRKKGQNPNWDIFYKLNFIFRHGCNTQGFWKMSPKWGLPLIKIPVNQGLELGIGTSHTYVCPLAERLTWMSTQIQCRNLYRIQIEWTCTIQIAFFFFLFLSLDFKKCRWRSMQNFYHAADNWSVDDNFKAIA